jgi:hypothetical protein
MSIASLYWIAIIKDDIITLTFIKIEIIGFVYLCIKEMTRWILDAALALEKREEEARRRLKKEREDAEDAAEAAAEAEEAAQEKIIQKTLERIDYERYAAETF